MSTANRVLTFIFLTAFSALVAEAANSGIPAIARRESSSSITPIWVSAGAALSDAGDLKPDLFSSSDLLILNGNRKLNATECRTFIGPSPSEEFADTSTLDGLLSDAKTVIRGRLGGAAIGFYNGRPGTLFALESQSLLKAAGRVADAGTLFLFVPEATIKTSSGLICARTFASVPMPAVGDEVIAFASQNPRDAEHRIIAVDVHRQLVVQHRDRLAAPETTRALDGGDRRNYSTLDDLQRTIEERKQRNASPAVR